MPAKNSVKVYVKGGYYHLYNRGVEKRKIFLDSDDYSTFLYLLKMYLSPKESKRSDLKANYYNRKNLSSEIELLAYCLMPNHFHFLVRQRSRDGITNLMRCVNTSYAIYFNRKYDRVGPLFQGKFKAVYVESDSYLLHLSRYIHLNPSHLNLDYSTYSYSSYPDYSAQRHTLWVNVYPVLNYFKTAARSDLNAHFSYQAFVQDYKESAEDMVGELALD